MIRFWNGLSGFTRLLAVVVIVSAVVGTYTRLRFQPQTRELRAVEKDLRGLEREVKQARERVATLEREAESALRWGEYARHLEDQSTGNSLREVISTCGTDAGPEVSIIDADFQRRDGAGTFDRIDVALQVQGSYDAVVQLLDAFDRSFPPIAFRQVLIERPGDDRAQGDEVVAAIEGTIHEPR